MSSDHHRQTVTGVILAGGQARRMQQRDKGLVPYLGQPMIAYGIQAMLPLVQQLLINANRNLEVYQQFGWPVITDRSEQYHGPLAGILSAFLHTKSELLLVIPCDSPLIQTQHLQRLIEACSDSNVDLAVASDGNRLHPVFLALRANLYDSLEAYIASGQSKIADWIAQQKRVIVDFSDYPDVFSNINTLEELAQLENETSKLVP